MTEKTTLSALCDDWLGLCWDYRPSAFWFWNADMDPGDMAAVVAEMAANDIREFLIHPVHGMEIEYLSPEFFDRYRHALRLAKAHGLKVWVYDEFGWPSGVAGGILLREYPEHKGWMLEFARGEDGAVSAVPVQSDRILDNTMGSPWTRSEAGYLDTLSVDAVRCFIELTHEQIRRECGELFDDVIAGFFTDEPVTMVDRAGQTVGGWNAVGVPWTPSLPARFRERFGYDIEPRYTELSLPGVSALKRDYWQLVKEMHIEAYHGQIGQWCRDHGVKYTGHVGEDSLLMQLRFTGSIFQSLSEMDEPGIDFLGHGPDPEDRFIEQVVVQSVARHAGKDRVYCEAYGITPFDIRLGKMLRRAQMMGVHGINDIALMGFHQALDGIRKRTYWPPIFTEAPWWPFYGEFRDAFARSVGLASLGERRARYAVLYPQEQLEQADPFVTPWRDPDPAAPVIEELARAIYGAGETFEFVFPEILAQARTAEGKIVFDNAVYDALLAPADLVVSPESGLHLDRLGSEGGRVMRTPAAEIAASVGGQKPSWSDRLSITGAKPGDLRVFEFGFADGRLFAIRNVTDSPVDMELSSSLRLAEWNPAEARVTGLDCEFHTTVAPRTCRYFSVTPRELAAKSEIPSEELPISAEWSASTETPNTARLSNLRFEHDELGWVDAEARRLWGIEDGKIRISIPREFAGKCEIRFQGEFACAGVPESIGILFERAHLVCLKVNGVDVDLDRATQTPVWDRSCALVDVRGLTRDGANLLEGTLHFQTFETSVVNHAFFAFRPMPTCDVCLAGSFRLLDGTITPDSCEPAALPLDLSASGWEQYSGILTLRATVEVCQELAGRIVGLLVVLAAEDCVELRIDGRPVGMRITAPYLFDIEHIAEGQHEIEIRVSSTSANVLDEPSPWGVDSLSWMVRHS